MLDFIGFSRVRFSFSWLTLELLFAVGYVGDYDIQKKESRTVDSGEHYSKTEFQRILNFNMKRLQKVKKQFEK